VVLAPSIAGGGEALSPVSVTERVVAGSNGTHEADGAQADGWEGALFNCTQHTTSPVLSGHHNRWSPKVMASMDIFGHLWTFYRHFTGVVHRLKECYLCIVPKDGTGSGG